MIKKILELRQDRVKLIAEARKFCDKAEAEKRAMTEDEEKRFDELMAKADDIQTQIDGLVKQQARSERLSEAERDAAAADELRAGGRGGDERRGGETRTFKFERRSAANRESTRSVLLAGPTSTEVYAEAFRNMLLGQTLSESQRASVAEVERIYAPQLRSMQADLNTAGGFLVPPIQFIAELLAIVDDQVFIRQLATVITMTNATTLGVPTRDTDVDDADWTTELAVGAESAGPTIGRRDLTPNPLAKYIKISNKLIRAAAINPEVLVQDRLAYKFGIAQEKAFMTGSGAGQPLGLFTATPFGISTNQDKFTGSATGFVADNLIDAKYFLKPQYWPKARWLFHRNAIAAIRKLKDSQGQYLWNPGARTGTAGTGLIVGSPDTLLDLPIVIDEYVPSTLTTGLYVGMLADFSKYWIVDALTLTLQRLVELFALTNQTAFIGRLETDAMPVIEEAFVRLKTS